MANLALDRHLGFENWMMAFAKSVAVLVSEVRGWDKVVLSLPK
jgi:hypothetical protein